MDTGRHIRAFKRWPLIVGIGAVVWLGLIISQLPVRPPKSAKDSILGQLRPAAVSDVGYVGSDACGECHHELLDSYRQHPMYGSTRAIGLAEFEELAMATSNGTLPKIKGRQRFYEVAFDGAVMTHRERMTDVHGESIFEQSVPMDYVVGSGRRAKAFVYHRGSKLLMSPLNLYAKSSVWDVAPGYLPDDPRRFDRRVTDECVMCHSGRASRVSDAADLFQKPAFHEMSIGCESCHGPGEKHIDARRSDPDRSAEGDPIINPARLDYERAESICQQCHLQAAARVVRAGRSVFDFKPGMRFEDVWTVLDAGAGVDADGQTRSVNHVPQMQSSRCFIESDSKLGCTSCHDPHRVPTVDERDGFYRARCLICHDPESCSAPTADREARADSCFVCHMPARESNNVSHITQTDHRIVRKSLKQPDLSIETPDQLTFFAGADQRLAPLERDRALGVGAWIHLSKKNRRPDRSLAKFLDGVLHQSSDDALLLAVLGSMAAEGRRSTLAIDYYERARRFPAVTEMSLNGLLGLYFEAQRWPEALDAADRLLVIDPGHARVHAVRADVLLALGKRDEAIDAAERALEFDPTLIDVRRGLVRVAEELGKRDVLKLHESILRRWPVMGR